MMLTNEEKRELLSDYLERELDIALNPPQGFAEQLIRYALARQEHERHRRFTPTLK